MGKDDLVDVLQQIKALVDQSLKRSRRVAAPEQKENAGKSAGAKNLSSYILALRDSAFFNQPKTAKEVHTKLQAKYSCDLNRVAVALLRLQRRKKLRKTSKMAGKTAQIAYVW